MLVTVSRESIQEAIPGRWRGRYSLVVRGTIEEHLEGGSRDPQDGREVMMLLNDDVTQ